MRDLLGPGTWVGYCTNVHPGRTLQEVKDNLERYACRVREMVCPGEELGIGLWLSAAVAEEVVTEGLAEPLRDWLRERGLYVFTINGFPYGDFSQEVVKHSVYQPNWSTWERQQYTYDLVAILSVLLPEGAEGSISTLPIRWRNHAEGEFAPSVLLRNIIDYCRIIEDRDGRLIHLDLEPEPGCVLGTNLELARYYDKLTALEEADGLVRRHLCGCFDICHAAVMFEDIAGSIDGLMASGLQIGKVQVSSGVRAVVKAEHDEQTRKELAALAEDRYLHQTVIKMDNRISFYEDLPLALTNGLRTGDAEWRVHFHVPIYRETLGSLGTTQDSIAPAVHAALATGTKHFEIETYAWNVLPPEHRPKDLAEGIAQELIWFRDLVKREIAP